MGEQYHRIKTCLIVFDEAHKGDVSKLYSETDDDNVSSKRATEMTIMMHNTDTLKSAYLLRATVNTDDEKEEPPGNHDDQDQAKLLKDMTKTSLRTTINQAPARRKPTMPQTTRREQPREPMPSCPRIAVETVAKFPPEVGDE